MRILLLLLASLIIIGCASPQSNRPLAKRKQAVNAVQQRFQALDIDGSGEISRAEFAESQAAQRSADPDSLFYAADTSGDGALTSNELQQVFRKLRSNRH
mgnify:FL=1